MSLIKLHELAKRCSMFILSPFLMYCDFEVFLLQILTLGQVIPRPMCCVLYYTITRLWISSSFIQPWTCTKKIICDFIIYFAISHKKVIVLLLLTTIVVVVPPQQRIHLSRVLNLLMDFSSNLLLLSWWYFTLSVIY